MLWWFLPYIDILLFLSWLRQVLAVARGILAVSCGTFHCSMRILLLWHLGSLVTELRLSFSEACGILVPWPALSLLMFLSLCKSQNVFSFLWKLVARNEILGCHIYIIVGYIMFLLSLFFIFIYLAAPGLSSGTWNLLVVASGIFINSCSMQILGCGTWDLVPWPGIELWTPCVGRVES